MINVTKYLKDNNYPRTDTPIRNFLRSVRVKYLIRQNGFIVNASPGRYGGTRFSDGLFGIFQLWLQRIPIPLLNRKEYEIDGFLRAYFGEEVMGQFKIGKFVYDWVVPSKNLLIEFNETTHNMPVIKNKDKLKNIIGLFIIHEKTAMEDLAKLVKAHPVKSN